MRDGARGIQSVEVSGRILRALVRKCEPMMLRDLAQAADLAPAQCHAYLTSLRQVDLVYQDPRSGLYSTGSFALRLGIGWLHSSPLAAATIRELKALTAETGFMSLMAVWGQFGPTIVHMNSGVTQTALNLRPGTIYSVTGTATGRVFAAFGTAPEIAEQIAEEFARPEHRDSIGQIMQKKEYELSLVATRANGFAVAAGAPIPGVNAVAAPVFGDGSVQFVAALIGSSEEMSAEADAPAVQRLLAATRALSHLSDSRDASAQPKAPRTPSQAPIQAMGQL